MRTWTKDEEEFVVACCESGWTHREIATEMNKTLCSIHHKCVHLNISNGLLKVKLTNEDYTDKLKEMCPTMIALEKYNGAFTKILHKCLLCNKEYNVTPIGKLRGEKCKYCCNSNNSSGIPTNKPGITYLVYIHKYNLYKFGITSKTIKERMRDGKIKVLDYEIILERKFSKGIEAMNLEKQWKENLKEYLVNTGLLKSGNTETFKI